jgi:hypothetical protein
MLLSRKQLMEIHTEVGMLKYGKKRMKHNDMTTSETQLVQRMFEMIVPLADTFALIFYERLFFLAPQVRPLFQTKMSLQREKLMTMLASAIPPAPDVP